MNHKPSDCWNLLSWFPGSKVCKMKMCIGLIPSDWWRADPLQASLLASPSLPTASDHPQCLSHYIDLCLIGPAAYVICKNYFCKDADHVIYSNYYLFKWFSFLSSNQRLEKPSYFWVVRKEVTRVKGKTGCPHPWFYRMNIYPETAYDSVLFIIIL